MKLKVDLECHKCYKKVKKVLSKFPRESLNKSPFFFHINSLMILKWVSN